MQSPRGMLILIFASLRASIQLALVNWLPWSVLNISGLPCLASASFKASTQKSASSVFDSRQARTLRLCQSTMATRYSNPRRIGM
jgi:hypothetical protein